MSKEKLSIEFEAVDSVNELSPADAALFREAIAATDKSYSPYSHFSVGAAIALVNGQTLSGSNQENASYPVGICAERVLLSAASALYPGVAIHTMAISYHNADGKSNKPISPCGICRQTLVEYETSILKHPIRLILGGEEGKIYIIPNASFLLPMRFTGEDMK